MVPISGRSVGRRTFPVHGVTPVGLEILHPPLVLLDLGNGLRFEGAAQIQFERLRWTEPHWRKGDRRTVDAKLLGCKRLTEKSVE